MSHCTFTPKINRTDCFANDGNNGGYATTRSRSTTPTRGRNVDDLLKWGEQRDRKIAGKRIK